MSGGRILSPFPSGAILFAHARVVAGRTDCPRAR